jgi:hypothetical protein
MAVPSPIATFPKDPSANLDYTMDWSDFLGDDTITSSTWALDAGIANNGVMFSRSIATIFIGGGASGTGYTATNHIATSGGRADSRSLKINVVSR